MKIILFFLILIFLILNKNYKFLEFFVTYKKCKKQPIKHIYKDVFDKYKINKTNKNIWDLYILCDYNKIKKEFDSIKPKLDNQKINIIEGCDKIVSKDNLWKLLVITYGRTKASKIMPESYLYNKVDLKLFKNRYNSNNIYILKNNKQRKKGILLSNNLDEIINGSKKYRVIQDFKKSLLINNRVFNLRLYMLVICDKDEKEFYIHDNIKCLYAQKNKKKDDNGDNRVIDLNNKLDKNQLISDSYKQDTNIYLKNPFTLQELYNYLEMKQEIPSYKIIKLKEQLFNNLILVKNAIKNDICNSKKKGIYFQLFGIDMLIDTLIEPYILEINKGPDMKPKDKRDYIFKEQIILDMLGKLDLIENYNNNNKLI